MGPLGPFHGYSGSRGQPLSAVIGRGQPGGVASSSQGLELSRVDQSGWDGTGNPPVHTAATTPSQMCTNKQIQVDEQHEKLSCESQFPPRPSVSWTSKLSTRTTLKCTSVFGPWGRRHTLCPLKREEDPEDRTENK